MYLAWDKESKKKKIWICKFEKESKKRWYGFANIKMEIWLGQVGHNGGGRSHHNIQAFRNPHTHNAGTILKLLPHTLISINSCDGSFFILKPNLTVYATFCLQSICLTKVLYCLIFQTCTKQKQLDMIWINTKTS